MVLLEFSMSPFDKGESLGAYVAARSTSSTRAGCPTGSLHGTIIEGEWDEVMAVVTACFERMKQDCSRVSTSIRIDYRAARAGA